VQVPASKQKMIAEELDRSTGEVLKKLEDARNRIL
jgi:splicing factor 3B subunit 3